MKTVKIKNRFVPHWLTYTPEEVEKMIVNKYERGMNKSQIGLELRDQYGIPSIKDLTKSNIGKLIKARGLKEELPEELVAMYKKAVKLHMHLYKEGKDKQSKRGLVILESRIKRLINYYKSRKTLPQSYEYSLENARLVVKL